MNILVVEDNRFQIEALTEYFRLHPEVRDLFDLSVAETVQAALKQLEQSSFDAILLDLTLPDSNGIDTFRAVHARANGTPILIWSADGDESTALAAMREGAQEYLLKGDVSHAQLARTLRNVIERVRATREITEARTEAERLQQHLASMSGGFVIYAPDFRISYINQALAEMVGSTVEYLTGKIVWDVFPDARSTAYFENLDRAMRERVPVTFEMHYDPLDLWVEVRAYPGPEGLFAYVNDITATKKVRQELAERERELRESEAYFRLLVDNLSDAVSLIDPTGLILYLSNVSEQVLGYTPEECIGRYCWEWVHPDDIPILQKRATERLQGDDAPVFTEVRMRHRNGEWRNISMRARLYPGGRYGEPALLITMRDITDAKRIEEDLHRTQEQLVHAQKLEAIGRLAGGVAHDFNNLLTAIGGHADLLMEQMATDATAKEELDEIKHGVERAATLTRQLLAFSRKQVMQTEQVDVNDVIGGTRNMLSRLIGENIDLLTQVRVHDAFVRADRGQLEQVIMNLVVNSRDAMPRGGRITIVTDVCTVTAQHPHPSTAPPGDYIRLTCSDSGTGMPKEVLDRVFEPFFTTKETGKGTGLGLATVYGIVKQSGGYIDVRSQLGHGTTFEILLPRVHDSAARARPAATIANLRGTGTVLLVEDEKSVRDVVCRVLKRAGYDVIVASDGEEALELSAGLKRLDLVLTDVIMPRMNGPELVRKLAETQPNVRVLFTSGYTNNAVLSDAGGGLAFLEKPFTPATLLDAVKNAIGAHDRNSDDR